MTVGGAGVVIVYRDALFGQGLASLLRADGAVRVLGVLAGDAPVVDRVRTLEPAVVILEGDQPEEDEQSLLKHLLEAAPCVVEVGLDHEAVAVHQRARIGRRRFVSLVARLARQARLGR